MCDDLKHCQYVGLESSYNCCTKFNLTSHDNKALSLCLSKYSVSIWQTLYFHSHCSFIYWCFHVFISILVTHCISSIFWVIILSNDGIIIFKGTVSGQSFNALIALPEDAGSFPKSHMVSHNYLWIVPVNPTSSFGLHRYQASKWSIDKQVGERHKINV